MYFSLFLLVTHYCGVTALFKLLLYGLEVTHWLLFPDSVCVVWFLALKQKSKFRQKTIIHLNMSLTYCIRTGLLSGSYSFAGKEVLCGEVREEAGEHLLQPSRQLALQLLLQAAVFRWVLAAALTGETHLLCLVWQQPKQLFCIHKQTPLKLYNVHED